MTIQSALPREERPRGHYIYNIYLQFRSILANTDKPYKFFIEILGIVRPNQLKLRARYDNDIVIDGFPRSANTFFVSHFEIAQNRPLSIGRHMHESWQIRFAEKNNIPCVILIRDPLSAVTSAMMRDPRARADTLLKNYIRLYENISRNRKRSILAPFQVVTTNPNSVIVQVNRTYGTEFKTLPENKISEVSREVATKDRTAFGTREVDPTRAASPSSLKKKKGEQIKKNIETNHGYHLKQAQKIYSTLLNN